jgi:3-methyladenine DNA glycosylase AlkD
MNEHARNVIEAIRLKQDVVKAKWLENYVKHDIQSFGVGIPVIREIVKQVEKDEHLSRSSVDIQHAFLNALMRHDYTEPKLAAILFIQLYWKTNSAEDMLNISSTWFDNKWISDWNVCDWLCVRLLTPVLDSEPELAVSIFEAWNKSPNLWKARASLVPFAQSKHIDRHSTTIWHFSSELIKREERFCKTSVGWVLREYSKISPTYVNDFLDQHIEWTTKEVINNATKYIG